MSEGGEHAGVEGRHPDIPPSPLYACACLQVAVPISYTHTCAQARAGAQRGVEKGESLDSRGAGWCLPRRCLVGPSWGGRVLRVFPSS